VTKNPKPGFHEPVETAAGSVRCRRNDYGRMPTTIKTVLNSSRGTGHFYVTKEKRLKRTMTKNGHQKK